jgi:uncharacterized protein YwqG
MDYHSQFRRAAIEQGIPEDAISRFADHLRFAIWTSTRGSGKVVGRLGGLPRLQVGTGWPSTSADEEGESLPLPFIASFDCAALPRVDGLTLPTAGSLLFFLEHEYASECYSVNDEQQFARVVYVPTGTETAAVAELPPGHDDWALCYEGPFLRPEHDLYATVHAELPRWLEDPDFEDLEFESDVVKELVSELTHIKELNELVGRLWPEESPYTDLYLGGYSMELGMGDNPESHLAADNIKERHPDLPSSERYRAEEEETQRVMREWLPLAQFQTRDDVYYGRFLIRNDDLAAGRFDKALSFTMFTE